MISLPNGCYSSDFNVNPKNWKTVKASTKKDWYITYRFYDPLFKKEPKYKKGKLVMLKGMNHYKDVGQRRQATQTLIANELDLLQKEGYNPITGHRNAPVETNYIIHPDTLFLDALRAAKENTKGSDSTKRDLGTTLRAVTKATIQLRFDFLPISMIARKHIYAVLKQIESNAPKPSPYRYNRHRTYIMMLFSTLIEMGTIDNNPVDKYLKKQQTVKKIKLMPSKEERLKVDNHLKQHYRPFWIFTHIFFHAGARITEMMQVKYEDVQLDQQRFKVLIKKGKQYKEVWKTIKDVALPFWQLALQEAKDGQFLFSKNLQPGTRPIKSYQITKRWDRNVMKPLKVTWTFYLWKFINTTETTDRIGNIGAAAQNSHTDTKMVDETYDLVGKVVRMHEKLKKVNNSLS